MSDVNERERDLRPIPSYHGLLVYMICMKTANTPPGLDRLIGPLADCLTPESARRVLALKADAHLQSHVNDLARRAREDRLAPAERAEYGNYVAFGTFVAILKSKARQRLAEDS